MDKVYIFGSTGYIGSHLKEYFLSKDFDVIDQRIDIRNYQDVYNALSTYMPNIVINAAGMTGSPNVDWCEDHAMDTISVNVNGALNIAYACDQLHLYFVHIGSGCIYEGDNEKKGFKEEDAPNFFGSLYSRSKAYSEKLLLEFNPLQLRVRIPIEGKSHPKNVIDKLKKYEKIISVDNSFTVIEDFVPAVFSLTQKNQRGIFNMTNIGHMNHEFLMSKYKEIVDSSFNFTLMSLKELDNFAKAKRSNTILNTDKRESLGVHMPDIKQRIISILQSYKNSL